MYTQPHNCTPSEHIYNNYTKKKKMTKVELCKAVGPGSNEIWPEA